MINLIKALLEFEAFNRSQLQMRTQFISSEDYCIVSSANFKQSGAWRSAM